MGIRSVRTENVSSRFVNKRNIFNPQTSTIVQLIVVGAGGGGAVNNYPGSGGPGGAVELQDNKVLQKGLPYFISIGAGGPGRAVSGFGNGSSGVFSEIYGVGLSITANGGECYGTFATRTILQSGTTYTGGNGAGGAGSGGSAPTAIGGSGRQDTLNIASSIENAGGTSYGILSGGLRFYGGGGGAGRSTGQGTHGGGNGADFVGGSTDGSINSGGGGGGGNATSLTAKSGASGLVIVRVITGTPATATVGSPTIINYENEIFYIFTGTGSITF
jgi:hypothetical protein